MLCAPVERERQVDISFGNNQLRHDGWCQWPEDIGEMQKTELLAFNRRETADQGSYYS